MPESFTDCVQFVANVVTIIRESFLFGRWSLAKVGSVKPMTLIVDWFACAVGTELLLGGCFYWWHFVHFPTLKT